MANNSIKVVQTESTTEFRHISFGKFFKTIENATVYMRCMCSKQDNSPAYGLDMETGELIRFDAGHVVVPLNRCTITIVAHI